MLNPYLLYIKLGMAAVVLIVLGIFAYKVHSWRQDSLALSGVRQEMKDLRASQKAANEASEGYQNELKAIRDRPIPNNPIRLCPKPRVSAPSSGPRPAVPAAGVVSESDGTDPEVRGGPDIGPALRALAKRADEVAAQGRATQGLHLKGPR